MEDFSANYVQPTIALSSTISVGIPQIPKTGSEKLHRNCKGTLW